MQLWMSALALVSFERLTQLDGSDVVMDYTAEGVADGPGLLADDNAQHVQLFGHPDGRTVS